MYCGDQRKFSTSINSLPAWSNCVYRIQRSSGDTATPPLAPKSRLLSKFARGVILLVAKETTGEKNPTDLAWKQKLPCHPAQLD